MEELRRTIAALFRRKGKDSISEKEFVFSASIDLRWFTPKEAQKVLDISLEHKLMSKNNGELVPNFDPESIDVPLDFKPSDDVFNVQVEDLFSRIVTKLSESKLERKELVAKINNLQRRYGIGVETAALMVGNDLGIDIKEFVPLVEKEIRKRAKDEG